MQSYPNEMRNVRLMLGLDPVLAADQQFDRQTLSDNVSLLTPVLLREVN